MNRITILGLFLLTSFTLSAAEGEYNMPDAVTATLPADGVAQKMLKAVDPAVLAGFKEKHPAAFWVFGEDRQQARRKGVIPAHWFEKEARQYQQFFGVAQPGEFYVFQACLIDAPALQARVNFTSLAGADTRVISPQNRKLDTVWLGIQIPADAKPGRYQGEVAFLPAVSDQQKQAPAFAETLAFTIEVKGEAVAADGAGEAWRLSRLKWLDSQIGLSDTEVTRPFTAIKVDPAGRRLRILGQVVELGTSGIPAQVTSFFSASNTAILSKGISAFAAAPALQCVIKGQPVVWKSNDFSFVKQSPVAVSWLAHSAAEGLNLTVRGELEYDGHLQLKMELSSPSNPALSLDDVRFVVPWRSEIVKYAMGLGLQGGRCPEKRDWKWNVANHQDAVWMGDVNLGAMLRFKDSSNFQRPLINAYYDFSPLKLPASWGSGGIRWEKQEKITALTAYSGPKQLASAPSANHFDIDWYLTPSKPLDLKKYFQDRYYHATQGAPLEDTAKLKQEGATILEVHHNRLCNPYINYPYNDDSIKHLKDFVTQAHKDEMRVAVYYTTRELTQNLPEFFALHSMDGELILPHKENAAWPVTNPQGPHPWLLENVGDNIVPAWRENLSFPEYPSKLDLAVLTTPDSRWNNFYLEGLQYLIKNVGIDGLYIDDTALDRKSMQRARRLLDANGNTTRRVSMHSWNHFNGLAKWSNSSIAFMELYPYYDGLWHGEGFNANASPEFMLVEMSGIPFGLMSEMLDHPNPWHGMVFGMRTRWPWSGDPRAQWRLEQDFGIEDSEFIGWWDPACPVKVDQPDCKVSVYRKRGKTFISLASWSPRKVDVKLQIDWKTLGINKEKATLWAPACEKLQTEAVFPPDATIPVTANQGWLFVVDETSRTLMVPAGLKNPSTGLTELAATEPFDLSTPANNVNTKDLAWVKGASVAMAHIEPKKDEGKSWGLGMAVAWLDGTYVQINARTDGQWSVFHNGAETLEGDYPASQPRTIAIRLTAEHVQLMAQKSDDPEGGWELISQFPRASFKGEPSAVRYGKIGPTWKPTQYADSGTIQPCRIPWVKLYGARNSIPK